MKTYPKTSIFALLGLIGRLIVGRLRGVTATETTVEWLQRQMERHNSKNIVINLIARRILLVAGADLSEHILAFQPSSQNYVAGTLKKEAMDFLAPNALTTSHDEQWRTLRTYNEKILYADAHHIHQQPFLEQVHKAFSQPIRTMNDVRHRMGQVMLGAVFGENNAPDHLIGDIQELFAEVGARTAMFGSKKEEERDRFHNILEELWQSRTGEGQPTLLDLAYEAKNGVDPAYQGQEFLIQQIPHWMFTFTNSGSDLLARSLAMIVSRADVLQRVRDEIEAKGDIGLPDTVNQLAFVEACIMETGRLFPPVSQTVHKAAQSDEFQGIRIPAESELLQLFVLTNRNKELDPNADHFQPDRWTDPENAVHRLYPNLFLSGARSCPGRNLILFINKAAIAYYVKQHIFQARNSALSIDPLPLSFPDDGLQL